MLRTVIGAAIGMTVGMLTLVVLGTWDGLVNGAPTEHLPPGISAVPSEAMWWCLLFFWIALPAGAIIGGTAAFGSWLVRPQRKPVSPARRRLERRRT